MRILRSQAVLILMISFLSYAITQDAWKDFLYLEDGFSITMPASPDYKTTSLDSDAGKLDVHAYTLEFDSNRGFALNVIDYKNKEAFTAQKIKEVFQLAKNGVIANTKGKLVSENEVESAGHQGLDFEIEAGKNHLHTRYYFSGSRLYTMMTIAPLGQPFAQETGRIFDSFRFL